jgi:hypothetical protein
VPKLKSGTVVCTRSAILWLTSWVQAQILAPWPRRARSAGPPPLEVKIGGQLQNGINAFLSFSLAPRFLQFVLWIVCLASSLPQFLIVISANMPLFEFPHFVTGDRSNIKPVFLNDEQYGLALDCLVKACTDLFVLDGDGPHSKVRKPIGPWKDFQCCYSTYDSEYQRTLAWSFQIQGARVSIKGELSRLEINPSINHRKYHGL